MFSVIILLIIWNWSLTPLWVNVVTSVLCGVNMTIHIIKFIVDVCNEQKNTL